MQENLKASTTKTLDRRELLRRGALTSGVGAAAVALGWTGAACGRAAETGSIAPTITPGSSTLTIDVACLGYTFRQIAPEGATFPDSSDPSKDFDTRGTTFSVEGDIYPEATISGNGFDPAERQAERIGSWFCRGWFLFHSDRPQPHVLTSQEYVLGLIDSNNLFPADQIASSGLEGPASYARGSLTVCFQWALRLRGSTPNKRICTARAAPTPTTIDVTTTSDETLSCAAPDSP